MKVNYDSVNFSNVGKLYKRPFHRHDEKHFYLLEVTPFFLFPYSNVKLSLFTYSNVKLSPFSLFKCEVISFFLFPYSNLLFPYSNVPVWCLSENFERMTHALLLHCHCKKPLESYWYFPGYLLATWSFRTAAASRMRFLRVSLLVVSCAFDFWQMMHLSRSGCSLSSVPLTKLTLESCILLFDLNRTWKTLHEHNGRYHYVNLHCKLSGNWKVYYTPICRENHCIYSHNLLARDRETSNCNRYLNIFKAGSLDRTDTCTCTGQMLGYALSCTD